MASIRTIPPIAILIILILGSVIVYAVSTQISFNNNVDVVVTVEVAAYTDASSTTPLTTITWGDIEPGQTLTEYIYLNSTSNVPVTLALTTDDWTPTIAADVFDLTWNLEGSPIDPGELLEATLTLTLNSDHQGVAGCDFTAFIDASEG